jgi:hypothetical protein
MASNGDSFPRPPTSVTPLSWEKARVRLRELLEDYLAHPLPLVRATSFTLAKNSQHSPPKSSGPRSVLSRLIENNVDLYVGALGISIALLVIACMSLRERNIAFEKSPFRPAASIWVYRGQVAASLILVSGSALSLWMLYRRHFLTLNDGESGKKREIYRFLRAWEQSKSRKVTAEKLISKSIATDIRGSSLTDIYPVYRKDDSSMDAKARWSQIPCLLLVEDDLIALQVGDVVPAMCVCVEDQTISLPARSRVDVSTLNETVNSIMNKLPVGRTTLPDNSPHLLSLCNSMRIYRVIQAPMYDFIRQKPRKYCRNE